MVSLDIPLSIFMDRTLRPFFHARFGVYRVASLAHARPCGTIYACVARLMPTSACCWPLRPCPTCVPRGIAHATMTDPPRAPPSPLSSHKFHATVKPERSSSCQSYRPCKGHLTGKRREATVRRRRVGDLPLREVHFAQCSCALGGCRRCSITS